jgi:Ala-tRNA(Pro) deacylase
MNVAEFLADKQIHFQAIPHRPAYDAQRLAQTLHVPGREVAKTVLLRANGGYTYFVAVLSASKSIDLDKVSAALGGSHIRLASEMELGQRCPDCEFGVLPPFGSQYGIRTLVDESLKQDEEILFEGNTHGEAIRMRFDDFCRLENPLIIEMSR